MTLYSTHVFTPQFAGGKKFHFLGGSMSHVVLVNGCLEWSRSYWLSALTVIASGPRPVVVIVNIRDAWPRVKSALSRAAALKATQLQSPDLDEIKESFITHIHAIFDSV